MFLLRKTIKPNLSSRVILTLRQSSTKSYQITEDNIQYINLKKEGDDVDDNYSLIVDGIVNTKLAFRNSKVSGIVNLLPAKVEAGKIALQGIEFAGNTEVQEAGGNISQNDFNTILESTRNYLSDDKDLFFEDLGLGASSSVRVGARVISDNPAHALIFRSLLINIPNRVPNHYERFNGWNLHERFENSFDKVWDGTNYQFQKKNEVPKKGERPIVAYIGGNNNLVGVQFEQNANINNLIAGANIIAGEKSSIRGIVNALSIAATTLINSENPHSIAIPSVVLSKNGKTIVVVGNVSDDFIAQASLNGSLYGAYANVISEVGISAIFNGVIVPSSQFKSYQPFNGFTSREPYPSVLSNDKFVKVLNPDNFISPATSFVFIGSESTLNAEDAANKIVQLIGDESKSNLAKSLLSSAKINVVNSENDLHSIIG